LQHPFEGTGNPRPVVFSGHDYWYRTFGPQLFIIYSVADDILKIEAISDSTSADIELTSDIQHNEAIDLMKRFMDDGKPMLGIFWYDYASNRLFGVEKGDAELYSTQGRLSTYPKLHKTYWQKMHHKARANSDTTSVFYGEHDYTQIPRGRVFLEDGIFYVNVGDWINGKINGEQCIDKGKLRTLLLDEFNLPDDFKFRQDIHWNIGHGWSEEQF